MLSRAMKKEVWHGYYNSARLSRYYQYKANRMMRMHYVVRLILLGSVIGSVVAFLDNVNPTVRLWVNLSIGIVVVVEAVTDFAKKSTVSHTISVECARLENEWHNLWLLTRHNHINESDVIQNIKALKVQGRKVTSKVGEANISISRRLNRKAAEDAKKTMESRYAA